MTRVFVRCIVKCPLSRALLDGTKRYIVTWTSWTTKRKKFNYHAVCARRTWKIHILYVHNRLSFDWCRRENCVNIATTSIHNVPEHRLIIQDPRIISFFVSVFTDIQAHWRTREWRPSSTARYESHISHVKYLDRTEKHEYDHVNRKISVQKICSLKVATSVKNNILSKYNGFLSCATIVNPSYNVRFLCLIPEVPKIVLLVAPF